MDKKKKILITVLSLIGLALSIELCLVYYNANFALNAKPSICAINESMDCDSVAKTSYSQFFGVPLALWGVILYIFFLFMTYVDKIQNLKFASILKVFKNPSSYIFCIASFSFVMSMILGGISIFKINSVCIFCFMTYFLDLLIALSAKNYGKGALYEVKTSVNDFIEAIKVKRNLFWLIMVMLLAASVLTYTTVTNVLAPQIALKKKMIGSFNEYKDMTDGTSIGPKDASIVINEYMDFNCGGCFFANIYLHRIVKEFENVKVVQHNLPLDKSCNHNMVSEGHKNSCLKSSYALAAAKQNKYWEMGDILFFQNPENEKQILENARLADFDIIKLKSDAKSDEVKQEILDSIADADSKNINGTPTLYIGIKQIVGVGSYPDLKQIVIEQGGIEKRNHAE